MKAKIKYIITLEQEEKLTANEFSFLEDNKEISGRRLLSNTIKFAEETGQNLWSQQFLKTHRYGDYKKLKKFFTLLRENFPNVNGGGIDNIPANVLLILKFPDVKLQGQYLYLTRESCQNLRLYLRTGRDLFPIFAQNLAKILSSIEERYL